MIKPWIKLSLWAVLLYLVFLIATLPAHMVINQTRLDANIPNNSIKLGHVTGTIWNAHISAIKINPKTILKNVKAQFRFVDLLTANMSVGIELGEVNEIFSPFGEGKINYGFSGLRLTDWQLRFPANMVLDQVKLPINITASGLVNVNVEQFKPAKPVCEALDGQIVWQRALVNAMKSDIEFGDVKADLSCESSADSNRLVALLSGQPNILKLAATAVYSGGSQYAIKGIVEAGNDASRNLANTIGLLPFAAKKGAYKLEFPQK